MNTVNVYLYTVFSARLPVSCLKYRKYSLNCIIVYIKIKNLLFFELLCLRTFVPLCAIIYNERVFVNSISKKIRTYFRNKCLLFCFRYDMIIKINLFGTLFSEFYLRRFHYATGKNHQKAGRNFDIYQITDFKQRISAFCP